MVSKVSNMYVYPKGFLSAVKSTTIVPKETPFRDEYNFLDYSRKFIRDDSLVRVGDKEIDRLFKQYLNNPVKVNCPKFRKLIFLTAFRLIPKCDFYSWYHVQRVSTLYGRYQKDFLEDTIKYLQTGIRSLNILEWDRLITSAPVVPTSKEESRFVKEFFDSRNENTVRNRDLRNILQTWWSKDDGIVDLLISLNIFFGSIE